MSDLTQQIVDSLGSLPASLVYLVMGLLGAIENVFPPIPADTAIAFGAFLTQTGELSALKVFFVVWTANVLSAAAVYGVSRKYGRPLFSGKIGKRIIKPRHFDRMESLYRDHGTWGIFVSRFIPGVRAVVSPFSGIAGVGVLRALGPVLIGSGIWYGALVFSASRLAREWDTVLMLIRRFNAGVLSALVITVVAVVIFWQIRRVRTA